MGSRRATARRVLTTAAAALAVALVLVSSMHGAEAPCEFTDVSRVVAIGDVHGAADRFAAILETARIIDDKQRWIGGTTHLVQVGDVVDRGPDSRTALDLLKRLETEAARAGGAVHALLGNHEVARMLGDLRFTTAGEYEAFVSQDSRAVRDQFIRAADPQARDELSQRLPLGQLELVRAFGPKGTYGEWLRTHGAVVKINGVVFVHGGISPAVAGLACQEINATVRLELGDDFEKTRAAPLASLAAREDGPLWYRGLAQLPDTESAAVDDLLSRQHARAMVIAHTVTSDGRIQNRFNDRLFMIDTGMQPAYAQGGRASALEIVGTSFTAIYGDRRDPLKPF